MTVAWWLKKGEDYLLLREVPEARANAECLMAERLGVGRLTATLQGARVLTSQESHQFWTWIKERGKRRPLAFILGHQPFLGIKIEVNKDSLVPRPETEELVIECERLIKDSKIPAPKIIEIGTGTGCVAIALAQLLPQASVFATDVSPETLRLAQRNALAHAVAGRVRFVREDLFCVKQGRLGRFDLLVSNPPYIPTRELGRLAPEVRAEPRLALDGGKDGLDAVRAIVKAAPKRIKPGGTLALEIGFRQAAAVSQLLGAAGFSGVIVKKDAQGLDRIAVGSLPKMIN